MVLAIANEIAFSSLIRPHVADTQPRITLLQAQTPIAETDIAK